MKLKEYNPDLCWNHPSALEYYDRWAAQYLDKGPAEKVVLYIAEHDPFAELLSPRSTDRT